MSDDLISRTAAIDSIRECIEVANANYEYDMIVGYSNAIECIQDLPAAQPEQRWIPVTERLPDTSADVLIQYYIGKELHSADIVKLVEASPFFDDRVFMMPHFAIGCYIEGDEGDYCWLCGEEEVPIGYHVIAWRELPEPYREDGQE